MYSQGFVAVPKAVREQHIHGTCAFVHASLFVQASEAEIRKAFYKKSLAWCSGNAEPTDFLRCHAFAKDSLTSDVSTERAAKALHPDKNPDNPEATKQFQAHASVTYVAPIAPVGPSCEAVSDAYRILGDDDRRRFSRTCKQTRANPSSFALFCTEGHLF